MTLAQYCASEHLDTYLVISKLQRQGVTATSVSNLRDLALSMNISPGELVRSLEN